MFEWKGIQQQIKNMKETYYFENFEHLLELLEDK